MLSVAVLAVAAGAANEPSLLVTPGCCTQQVDVSAQNIFHLRWHEPLLRAGMHRGVGAAFGQPAVSLRHSVVISGTAEGDVVALRLADGGVVWRVPFGVDFESAATLVALEGQEVVLLSARDGTLLALMADSGKSVWRAALGAEARAPGQVVGTALFIATADNKVHCLDLATGKARWQTGRGPPTKLTVVGHSRPAVARDRVFASFSDGYVEAYALADGALLWSRPTSFSPDGFGDADADPVIAEGRVYVASYSDGIYALDAASGTTIWHVAAPATTSLAAYERPVSGLLGGLVIAASADGYLWGLERKDGAPVFRTRLPAGPTSRLTVRQGLAVMTSGANGLLVFAAHDGRPQQATALGVALQGDPTWVGRALAVLSDRGELYRFELGGPSRVQ